MSNHPLPLKFIERLQSEFAEKASLVLEAMDTQPPVSIRKHPLRQYQHDSSFNQVAWNKQGIYLEERPIFTIDPLFHAGAYYPQEAGSMILGHIMESLGLSRQEIYVLDLCAAPGGKSSLILDKLHKTSLLVANETIGNRCTILAENLARWGYPNYMITQSDPNKFGQLRQLFDMILIDAPCSGEGLFRKDIEARNHWSQNNVELCSARQKRIVNDSIPALKDDGILIYSTCTYNADENIKQVISICNHYQMETILIPMDTKWNIMEININGKTGYQFAPGVTKSEGFFIAVMKFQTKNYSAIVPKKSKKLLAELVNLPEEIIQLKEGYKARKDKLDHFFSASERHWDFVSEIAEYIFIKQPGTELGTFKAKKFIPSQALAHSLNFKLSGIQHQELNKTNALDYLRRGTPVIQDIKDGWNLICYESLPLGWANVANGRFINKLPMELRIRNF